MGNWQREEEGSQLVDFMATVKQGLKLGLEQISLQLVDLELWHQPKEIVLAAGSEAWLLRAVVVNPVTKQQKESHTQFQGVIGDTDVESVKPMVVKMVAELRKSFYSSLP